MLTSAGSARVQRAPQRSDMRLLPNESAEDHFRAVFGSGRSSSSRVQGHPRGLRLPSEEDYLDVASVSLAKGSVRLWHLEAESGDVPFFWATMDATLTDPSKIERVVIYHSCWEDWQDDSPAQISLLANAVEAARTSTSDYGTESSVKSLDSGEALHIGDEHVRIVGDGGEELVYWNSDEFAEDPSLVCGALLGALQVGGA